MTSSNSKRVCHSQALSAPLHAIITRLKLYHGPRHVSSIVRLDVSSSTLLTASAPRQPSHIPSMAASASSNPHIDLSSLLSDTSSKWTAASIASQLTLPLLSSLPSQLHTLSSAAVRLLLLALLQCRPAVLSQARDAIRGVVEECDSSDDEWVRWLASRLREYQAVDAQPASTSEQETAVVRRVQQAVRGRGSQYQQSDKEERKEEDGATDSKEHTAPTSSTALHGSAFLPCLPYYCHFLSPELLPAQLTTNEPLPSAASSTSQSSRLRLVSPPAVHFTVRRRFAFFDQHNSDDTAMADTDIKDAKLADVSTSPAAPPAFKPTAAHTPPATPSATAAPLSSTALPSPTSSVTTPRRIALPSSVPHVHPRPLQSPSSASSPLALAASRLGTRPSLPPPSLTRQPSLHRPMSLPKAGRGVVMIGLEEAGGLTDLKQRVREEKEKERREKEEEKRQEAEKKKEEKEKERKEKEEEKRVEAERRREEKEEKERQRRAEKEEKERKRLEWHRVREEKAKVREEKKKKDEEVQKQREDETVAHTQEPPSERKEAEEAINESHKQNGEEQSYSTQEPPSAEHNEMKQTNTVDGQSSSMKRHTADGSERSTVSMEIESAANTPSHSTHLLQQHSADSTWHTEQQQPLEPQSTDASAIHSPPLHPLPALPDAQVGLESEEAKRKRREDKKRRKQQRRQQQQQQQQQQQHTDTNQPPPQQSSSEEEKERERKKRKREKKREKERSANEKGGEKVVAEAGKAVANETVVKRHRPSCKRKA